MKTVAKGARRPKSKFAGMLDLFYQCEIQYAPRRQSELHLLAEVRLVQPYEQLRFDYPRMALAAYFVELLDAATEADTPVPELYELLVRGLEYLNRTPASRRAMLHFENELARLQGYSAGTGGVAAALADHLHRLPAGRAALLRDLPEREGGNAGA